MTLDDLRMHKLQLNRLLHAKQILYDYNGAETLGDLVSVASDQGLKELDFLQKEIKRIRDILNSDEGKRAEAVQEQRIQLVLDALRNLKRA